MDFENLLSSPPQFFSQFLRLALSLLRSTIAPSYRRSVLGRCSLADFDIDPQTGFFPRHPLPRLTGAHQLWEQGLAKASGNIYLGIDTRPEALEKRPFGERWRKEINDWPVLDASLLCANSDLLRRAHYVLAWLVHYYVHSQPCTDDESCIRVPKSLAVPLVQVSRRLDIAPVLTFADTVLWNLEPVDPCQSLSLHSIDSMRAVNLFSGTEDEKSFYVTSAKAELRGIEVLRIVEEFRNLPNADDLTTLSKLSRDLARLAKIIDDISEIIQNVRSDCDPEIFHQFVRPWFVGSDAGPNGPNWVYEGVSNSDQLDLSGPSAGQSSIMHALDIFLDIDHKLRQKRYPAPSPMNKRADLGFMERMRRYMPGKHREYLSRLASMPRTIRDVAQSTPALREPYDTAVDALKRLRDLHLRVACLYIVSMSRRCPMMARLDHAAGPCRGTGGTEVSILLKTGRDNTRRAMFKS
ncbi:hypothetical protein M378DRAFT_175932 [Amanita muscaria Koide BX008]|uniref:Indoleamine 2,3-dioxygenase n=1 Tax=Amanita muscaria (strain Koide BX008) TaxID=946122 RepID=A0A0C2TRC5_AMAMK|nr:hypothetical protein M378DRAFT_175932 [Amanita muscaria Koide BX008]